MFRLRSIVPRNTQNAQKFSSARKFCEFCGSTFLQEVSVCSVNSVGRCNGCSVGAAETAAPPGWVRVAALNNPPTDGTDAHRCLGCVILSHGTRRIHRSLLLWEDAVAAWLVQFLLGWCSGDHCTPWKAAWVWQDAIPSYKCTDWEGVLKYLCASVTSVGGYLSKRLL